MSPLGSARGGPKRSLVPKQNHPFAVKHKNCLYKELLNRDALKHRCSFQITVFFETHKRIMANGVYSKYELYKISCREGNIVPGWCSPFSEVYKLYVQNEKRRVIWKGARSVPAVDQALSGLANHPDNWLKLDDVCHSNPVFWLILE